MLLAMFFLHESLAISNARQEQIEASLTPAEGTQQASTSMKNEENNKDHNDEIKTVKSGEKKVLGIFDEIPENENFKVTDEVEDFFKDQISAKIKDFDELKIQIAVLDRHLRKHSGFGDFNETDHMLIDLDEKVLKPYEDSLKVLKNKIVAADHDNWSATTVNMINTIVEKAETFLEISRERVYGTLDDHIASDEHKKEHAEGHGHVGDHSADYDDLISPEEELKDQLASDELTKEHARGHGHTGDHSIEYDDDLTRADVNVKEAEKVAVSAKDEELLIEYIDMDINDLENIIKQKANLEHHIVDHLNLDDVEPDELQLKIAEDLLQNIDLVKLKSYEKSLQSLKSQIRKASGELKLDTMSQISATMEKAEDFLDASQKKLNLVGELDMEFEEFVETENLVKTAENENMVKGSVKSVENENLVEAAKSEPKEIMDSNNVNHLSHPDEAQLSEKIIKKAEPFTEIVEKTIFVVTEIEDSSSQLKEKSFEEESELISTGQIFPFHLSATLTILTMVVLVGMLVSAAYRIVHQSRKDRNLEIDISCESGRTPSDGARLIGKEIRSPELEMVKEDDGWNSTNWSKPWAGTPTRRKRK